METDPDALCLAPPFAPLDRQILVGRLARAMAHQISSPLTALVVLSDYLVQQLPADGDARADATEIQRAAQRCSELLEGFRAIVRRERGTRPAPVQLATVVDEIKPLLRHALMINRLSLDADLPAALRPVRADRADVEHLLLRLVLGIVDAAPAGATITVEGRDDGDAVALRIAVNSTGAAPSVHGPRDGLAGTLGRAACEELAAELGGTLALDEAAGVLCGAHLRLPAWC